MHKLVVAGAREESWLSEERGVWVVRHGMPEFGGQGASTLYRKRGLGVAIGVRFCLWICESRISD